MEETIGYEAAFSPEEWDAINSGDWSDVDLEFGDRPPGGGGNAGTHEVTIYNPPGQYAGNEKRYEIECERCGEVGNADDMETAQMIARLHENLLARVIEAGRTNR